jgi:NDP-sugar pyrophosphorylase family protein
MIPKPLLPIGEKPIMEWLIEQLRGSGVKDIGVAVNHRAELLEAYFQDGVRFGIRIHYMRELAKLGTAGPLAAFSDWIRGPVIVINGDILTTQDFADLHAFHLGSGAEMTVGVRSWQLRVPYGVIEADQGRVRDVTEKPAFTYLVSAGMYVIEPSVIASIPKDEYLDVPDLVRSLVASGRSVAAYLIRAAWMDVGNTDDLITAGKLVEEWQRAAMEDGSAADHMSKGGPAGSPGI